VKKNQRMEPDHRLCKGPYRGPLYGFELAELSTMPKQVMDNATTMALQLRAKAQAGNQQLDDVEHRRRAQLRLGHRLRRALDLASTSNAETMSIYLNQLRQQFEKDLQFG